MSAQSHAWVAAIGSADGRRAIFKSAVRGVVAATAIMAAGCTPATTRVAGIDPADPAARIARVGYRSTVAPYTAWRPSTPAPWRERNDSVAPKPRGNSHEH
ncbi:hypothetical protein [Bradyrhizobium australiense]|uniref:Uncharacterized protein n=1 Tax=Bradyrhizobium australiense TaxID=2721161 RepID=A0A7Y4GYM5_9BRAD|nr:hypothetical protein [Bradyrhizobium australiense]NOJ44406.1 hypothetical protein [Bradyrhizobium australiense]